MHALEWIEQHGRYLRSINAATLRKHLERAKRTCTWCGDPVPKSCSTWCSKKCVEEFQLRCDPAAIRRHIASTRPLACAICGRDITWLQNLSQRAKKAWYNLQRAPLLCDKTWKQVNRRGRRNRRRMERWSKLWSPVDHCSKIHRWVAAQGLDGIWEADHILPVVEGGGLCGPDGYRVLCIPCHKRETARLASRRADAKRPPKKASRQKELAI